MGKMEGVTENLENPVFENLHSVVRSDQPKMNVKALQKFSLKSVKITIKYFLSIFGRENSDLAATA